MTQIEMIGDPSIVHLRIPFLATLAEANGNGPSATKQVMATTAIPPGVRRAFKVSALTSVRMSEPQEWQTMLVMNVALLRVTLTTA